jgi:hypothetical protein
MKVYRYCFFVDVFLIFRRFLDGLFYFVVTPSADGLLQFTKTYLR